MDAVQKIRAGEGDFLLFGITPPKASAKPEDLDRIAQTTLGRLRRIDADAVALYDIAEEQDRSSEDRPFPFLPTVDPADFLDEWLTGWDKPTVMYRAVGKYGERELGEWMKAQSSDKVLSMLVGVSSSDDVPKTSLSRAYELRAELNPDLQIGAVMIPERHIKHGDEHIRMLDKQEAGVSFFVSQILYDVNAAKDVIADYRDECDARGVDPRPVVFTLSVCGSVKTLDFLAWLGVKVPRWIQRDLRRAESTVEASCDRSRAVATEMVHYCRRVGVPVGLNVESVSSRKVEIEAAMQLADDLREVLGQGAS